MTTLPVVTFTVTLDDLVILMTFPLPTGGSVSVDWYCFAGGAASTVAENATTATVASTALRTTVSTELRRGTCMVRYLRSRGAIELQTRALARTTRLLRGSMRVRAIDVL